MAVRCGKRFELLEDHANFAADGGDVAHVVAQLHAVDDDLAFLVFFEAVDAADEGGFTGARGTDDDDHLARGDGHADVTQDVKLAKPLVHVAANDDRLFFITQLTHNGALVQRGVVCGGHGVPPGYGSGSGCAGAAGFDAAADDGHDGAGR